MIGICIPAHNEEELIDACLESVAMATLHPDLAAEEIKVVVVLDSCSDGSAAIARQWPFVTLAINARKAAAKQDANGLETGSVVAGQPIPISGVWAGLLLVVARITALHRHGQRLMG